MSTTSICSDAPITSRPRPTWRSARSGPTSPGCTPATLGVRIMGQDVNILTQIGFVVLVGLAAKNAILIVEFARDIELDGRPRLEAVIEACRLRLRPILMTSFAFILGVLPLVVSTGSGSE